MCPNQDNSFKFSFHLNVSCLPSLKILLPATDQLEFGSRVKYCYKLISPDLS